MVIERGQNDPDIYAKMYMILIKSDYITDYIFPKRKAEVSDYQVLYNTLYCQGLYFWIWNFAWLGNHILISMVWK